MTSKETRIWQPRIRTQIKLAGGWSRKWSSNYLVGVPDIVAGHPNIGAFFIEVKLVDREFYPEKFDRKLNVTSNQTETLKNMAKAGMNAFVLVVHSWKPRVYGYSFKRPENLRVTSDDPMHVMVTGSKTESPEHQLINALERYLCSFKGD